MNIAFDIDGVLTDFEWFLNVYGRKYFKRHIAGGVNICNTSSSSVSERFGVSKKWEKKFYARYLFWYARKYPIRENAAEAIHMLRQQGHTVYFITARALADEHTILGSIMRSILKKWLRKNRVEYDKILFVPVNNSAECKYQLAKKHKIDIFIEDEPRNIEKLKKICRVICMEASYNKNIKEVDYAIDFGEVYYLIRNEKIEILSHHEMMQLEEQERIHYLDKVKRYYKNMPYDRRFEQSYRGFLSRVAPYLQFLGKIFCIQIEGKELLNQGDGAIYVCNHRRAFDILLCYYILNTISARFLIKRECEEKKYAYLQRKAGTIFVIREEKKSKKIAKNIMLQCLFHGGNVLLYPEGTRNRSEELLLSFQTGAVRMAQIVGCPICPIVIYKDNRIYKVRVLSPIYIGINDCTDDKNEELRLNMMRVYEELKERYK